MKTTLALALALVSAAACNKHAKTCDTYADWSMKCDKDSSLSGDDKKQAETMINGMCLAAFSDEYGGAKGESRKMMEEMYANLKSAASCAESAKSCDDFKKCEDLVKK